VELNRYSLRWFQVSTPIAVTARQQYIDYVFYPQAVLILMKF